MPGTEWLDEEQKARYAQWAKETEGVAGEEWLISNLAEISSMYCNVDGTVVLDGGTLAQGGTTITNPIKRMSIDQKSLEIWKKEDRGLILVVEGDGFQTRIPVHHIELGLAYALSFTPKHQPPNRQYNQVIGFTDYLKETLIRRCLPE